MSELPVLVVATANAGKVKEIRLFLEGLARVETLLDHPELEPAEETEDSFEGNARLKAESIARQLECAVLADDSGLVVDALDGDPGVRSARYCEGSDADRTDKVLHELEALTDPVARTARFVCAMAFAAPGKHTVVTEGKVEGRIGFAPRGDGGFGYDPIFHPDADPDRTTAELTPEEKQAISHRGAALRAMREHLQRHFSLAE